MPELTISLTGADPRRPRLDPLPGSDALAGLDPEQREVAEALRGPVCVLAGAGTGKTRAITHRIAHGVQSGVYVPQRVLAVTFTTRAAGEMRGRLRRLGADGVQARTFHSAALRQLRFFWPQTVGGEFPRMVESKAPLIAEAASRHRIRPDASVVRDLASEIEWAKVSRISPDEYAARATSAGRAVAGHAPEVVGRVYASYGQVTAKRGLIDFEDVLLLTVAMLEDSLLVAEQVQAQYHHFVVDEYQDVNLLQQRLLELWLGRRQELCVVGDPSQTIYSFAGASPDHLVGFRLWFPQARLIRLERDYRSTDQVVELANGLLAAARGPIARARLRLRSEVGPGPAPTFAEYADEPAEADGVTAAIGALIAAGTAPRDVAVLFRINAQSESYEQALGTAGVPYVVRGLERFFDRAEVKQASTLLRGAARAERDGSDPAAASDGAAALLPDQVRAVLASAGWAAAPPSGGGAVRARWESLAAVVSLADDLSARDPAATLTDLVAELESRASAQHAPAAEGVTLATLHAAKGLEWDAVFLVGLADGTVPLVHAEGEEQVEEERRLLYVGATRARRVLSLTWARSRSPSGRNTRRPSRFLDGLRPTTPAEPADDPPGRATKRSRAPIKVAQCRGCGRGLRTGAERKIGRCDTCPPTYDEELLERLRTWRSARAKEQALPAYCVFTDATLVAVAEAVPASAADLSKISGIGAAKIAKYGSEVLDLCTDEARGAELGA